MRKHLRLFFYFAAGCDNILASSVIDLKKSKGKDEKMIKQSCDFEYAYDGSELYIKPTGEIDHHSAAFLRGKTDELIYRVRPTSVRLDLSGIGFMDSSGLGFIMGRYSLLSGLGGKMVISDPSEAVMRILTLVGIGRIVPVEYSETKGEDKNEK